MRRILPAGKGVAFALKANPPARVHAQHTLNPHYTCLTFGSIDLAAILLAAAAT
jgi:hypothetical protein